MKSRIYIEAYDCVTSTGNNPASFWNALDRGFSGMKAADTKEWPLKIKNYWADQSHAPIVCKVSDHHQSALETLSSKLALVARAALKNVEGESFGIIFASTKGAVEDFVWGEEFSDSVDPLELVLNETIKKLSKNKWKLKQVVSNSCASSHTAFALASKWIEADACDKVLVIAGDLIGPFIHTGFQSLKALSGEMARPFQDNRDGLVLGEAMTAIILSDKESEFELLDCQIFNEAHTVTGASPEGRGLFECIKNLRVGITKPDFAIAHGTATFLNDQIEDKVLSEAQRRFENLFFISGTKWSIGHTLGASGSVDLIAAMESLKNQRVFSLNAKYLKNTTEATNYVYETSKAATLETVLVTSLGFGGTNGALMVKRCVQ